MRVIFVNLHTNTMFMRNAKYLLSGQKAIDKHAFLIEWALNNNIEIANFVTSDSMGSTLPSLLRIFRKSEKQLKSNILESKYCLRKSRLKNAAITILTNPEEIKENDIIIFYAHFPDSQNCALLKDKGIRIGDYIHFYGDRATSDMMRELDIKHYVFEVNLEKYCGLYRKYYSWFQGDYIQRRFAYQQRFKNRKAFDQRKNKALAIGTITTCDCAEFVDYFGNNVYQPKRKMIRDNQSFLRDEIDSFISDFQEIPRKIIHEKDIKIKKYYKKLFNYFTNGKQKKYFSFDMVEKFNEYKMFICPEDAIGAYGIGTVEGMACGCAMIGWNYGVYEDLGLVNGIHYISYDGTVENLKEAIDFWQKEENQDKLRIIAENGCKFVRENFSQEKVARDYFAKLYALTDEGADER